MPYKDKEKSLENARKRYWKNRDLIRERRRERSRIAASKWYHSRTPEQKIEIRLKKNANRALMSPEKKREMRRKDLLAKYGLTVSEYEQMADRQSGCCAICGIHASCVERQKGKHVLVVDHDHETGVVRELLCNHCNSAVGYVRENAETASRMVAYLLKWKKTKDAAA